jgi:hypothetical protein
LFEIWPSYLPKLCKGGGGEREREERRREESRCDRIVAFRELT